MSFAYLRVIQRGDVYSVVELIAMTPVEGVPPRPTPGPTPPGGGNGGPVDPGYSPPWAQIPVDPGYFPPGVVAPPAGSGTLAAVFDPPAGATPPSDPVPAGWTVKLLKEKGHDGPSWAYVGPYLQHN